MSPNTHNYAAYRRRSMPPANEVPSPDSCSCAFIREEQNDCPANAEHVLLVSVVEAGITIVVIVVVVAAGVVMLVWFSVLLLRSSSSCVLMLYWLILICSYIRISGSLA